MKIFKIIATDFLLITGFGSLIYGFYQVYPASAWIVGGTLVLFAMSRKYKKGNK